METPYTDLELITSGAEMIRKERMRQQLEKKYDAAHDDLHVHGELAIAAIAYAMPTVPTGGYLVEDFDPIEVYPWGDVPESLDDDGANPIRRLVIAGAFIAAEIERLQRELQREMTAVLA